MSSQSSNLTKKALLAFGLLLAGVNTAAIRNLQGGAANCRTTNPNGTCATCIFRTVKNTSTGFCDPVSDQCRTWNESPNRGECTSCYDGYSLVNGQCVVGGGNGGNGGNGGGPIGSGDDDPNCQCYDDDKNCIDCFDGFYLNSQGECVQIPDNCQQVDSDSGDCEVCDDGFEVNDDGECQIAIGNPDDPCIQYKYVKKGCHNSCYHYNHYFHGCEKVCVDCADGFYLDNNNQCQENPDNCEQANSDGECVECESGFFLTTGGECVDLVDDCTTFDPATGDCVLCNVGFYLTPDGQCEQIPENCAQVDATTGECLQCEDGFELGDDGECQISIGNPDDPCVEYKYVKKSCYHGCYHYNHYFHGCKKVCVECADGFYLDNHHQCQENPDNCEQANSDGDCVDCDDGFTLTTGGDCVQIPENCAETDPDTGDCIECDDGFELNDDGQCDIAIGSGQCDDFTLCKTVSADGNTCTSCVYRAYLDDDNCCVAVDPHCKYWLADGTCKWCYYGFTVNPHNHNECISKHW